MARARGSFGNNWHEAAGVVRVKYRSRHKDSWDEMCYGYGLEIGGGCRRWLVMVMDWIGKFMVQWRLGLSCGRPSLVPQDVRPQLKPGVQKIAW